MNTALENWSKARLQQIIRDMRNPEGPPDGYYECQHCDSWTRDPQARCSPCATMFAERRDLKNSPWTQAAVRCFGEGPWQAEVGLSLEVAANEGRLDPDIAGMMGVPTGEYRCTLCGMRWIERQDAVTCCTGGAHGRL